jgi:soluble lytic murein transglycosylase-like protein
VRRATLLVASAAAGWLLAIGARAAEAQLVRLVDEEGVVHFTNQPCEPRYVRLAPGACPSAPGPTSAAPAPDPAPVPAPDPVVDLGRRIEATALRHGVDPRLVEAVVRVESAGDPGAVSPKGAMGLMQLMPARAASLGVRDAFDPAENLDGGVRHLRELLDRYRGNLSLALAAYNAGEEAVRRHGGIPPYPETRDYVRRILARYGRR